MDQENAEPVAPITVMTITTDRAATRIRYPFEERQINVDGRAELIDSRIKVILTVGSDTPRNPPNALLHRWIQQFSVVLASGKPFLAVESIDPVTKRRLAIEVKATILK